MTFSCFDVRPFVVGSFPIESASALLKENLNIGSEPPYVAPLGYNDEEYRNYNKHWGQKEI
jgi:hypothetical protein